MVTKRAYGLAQQGSAGGPGGGMDGPGRRDSAPRAVRCKVAGPTHIPVAVSEHTRRPPLAAETRLPCGASIDAALTVAPLVSVPLVLREEGRA